MPARCPHAQTDRPEVLTEMLMWAPAGTSETLPIDLVALFTEAKR